MLPANIDGEKVQLVAMALGFFGLSMAFASYVLRSYMRRWGWIVVMLLLLATAGGLGYFSGPYALLTLLFSVLAGLPILIGHFIQLEKEDREQREALREAISEDRNAAS